MEELRHLDEVAYVRFASVYRQLPGRRGVPRGDPAPAQRATGDAAAPRACAQARSGRAANRDQLPLLPADDTTADKRDGNK